MRRILGRKICTSGPMPKVNATVPIPMVPPRAMPAARTVLAPLIADELTKTPGIVGDAVYATGKYAEGAAMFEALVMDDNYEEFLTLPAYRAMA